MATSKEKLKPSALETYLAANPAVSFKKDIRQRDLEAYEELYNEYAINDIQGMSRINSKVLQAAAAAGWITGLDVAALPDMNGWDVAALAQEAMRIYGNMGRVDPLT